MKQPITTQQAPPPGPYSQAVRAGDWVFVSGQGPLDPASKQIVGTTIQQQTRRVLDNIKAIVEAAGATMADVAKSTVHLLDIEQFDDFNAVYVTYFEDPKMIAKVSRGLGEAMPSVEIDKLAPEDRLASRGW